MTKVNSMGKRLGAAVMACAMAMAMAVSAGAVDAANNYTAAAYEQGSTSTLSMADDAIDKDRATIITAVDDGYKVEIPLEPMTIYGYVGYVTNIEVEDASDVEVTEAPYEEGAAAMSFVVEELPADMTFTIGYDVAIYTVDGEFFGNHSDFPGAPASIAADVVLTAAE